MKQLFFLFIFLNLAVQSQNYTDVDAKVKSYPKFTSAQKLAAKIDENFTSDNDKIRATFIWLTENIRYDLKEFYNPTNKRVGFSYKNEAEKQTKLQQIKDDIVNVTFKTRKSVCEGYAQSFKKVCDLLQIEAIIIKGYARNSSNEIGLIPSATNHAWNAVKLNNKWQLVDATWAAGYAINNKWEKNFTEYYFYPNPSELSRTHLPENETWQLVTKPINKKEYASQPIIGQGFFYKNLVLISPTNGILSKKGTIEFKIKNLSATEIVSYQFKGQRYGKKVIVKLDNSVGNFTINLEKKRKTELYIFINNEIALQYKIK
jgi:transglutaminase/protease-like cytokinesis protein 3